MQPQTGLKEVGMAFFSAVQFNTLCLIQNMLYSIQPDRNTPNGLIAFARHPLARLKYNFKLFF